MEIRYVNRKVLRRPQLNLGSLLSAIEIDSMTNRRECR